LLKYNKFNVSDGFTVFEVLIVVTIIFIVTSIVLVNVTTYINKGKDSSIKGDLASLLLNGSLYFDNHGDYNNFCNDSLSQNIFNAIVSLRKNCNDSDEENTNWAACARLNVPVPIKAWCVDSTGTKKQINNSQCTNGIHSCP